MVVFLQELHEKVRQMTSPSSIRTKSDEDRVKMLKSVWSTMNNRLSFRLSLGKLYYDFHRHRKTVRISITTVELNSDGKKRYIFNGV